MAEWNEGDHPRDKNNQKFVKKGSGGQSKTEREKRQELERKYNDDYTLPLAKKGGNLTQGNNSTQSIKQQTATSLTSREWAIWYQKVAEIKKLKYYADKTSNGYIIPIEINGSHKIVLTGGTFEKPKAKKVYSFRSIYQLNDYIAILKGRL